MNTHSFRFFMNTLIVLLACLMTSAAWADNVSVDFDSSVDFNKLKTFQMMPNPKGALVKSNPLLASQIEAMIVGEFEKQGLSQVSENGDLQVSFDASTKENHVLNTMGMGPGIGFGVGWRRWGMGMGGMATTTVSTFTEGTLVIDGWTMDPKQMVWRGVAEASVVTDAQKTKKNIQKSLDKLFEKWDRIKQKDYGDKE